MRIKPLSGLATTWQKLMWQAIAVLVIAWLLARWTWALFAPGAASVLPAVTRTSVVQAEHVFGIAAVTTAVTVQAALPNVKLVGVFAGTPGFAIVEIDGKRQLGLKPGDEIAAGAKLVEVGIDHVLIERGGVRQSISLEGRSTARATAAGSLAIAATEAAVLSASAVSALMPDMKHKIGF
jgi:general secretion pathway protein C